MPQDTFTGANGTGIVAYSPNWAYNVGATTDLQIQTNALGIRNAGAALEVGARRTEAGYPNDQFSQGTFTAVGAPASQTMGVAVRGSATGTRYYGFYANGSATSSQLFKYDGTTWTQLGSSGAAYAVNDSIRLEVTGTSLRPMKNGATISPPGTQTDATYANGAPGVCGFNNFEAAGTVRIDNFLSTDPPGGGLPMPHMILRERGAFYAMARPPLQTLSAVDNSPQPTGGTDVSPLASAKPRLIRQSKYDRAPFLSRVIPGSIIDVKISGVWSAPGDSSATWIGAATFVGVWSAPGDSSATWIGAALGIGVWNAPGDSSAAWVGEALGIGVWSASGDSSADWLSLTAGNVWAASGDSSAAWIGASDAASAWSAPGDSSATWVGAALGQGVWSASGDSLASWVGSSITGSQAVWDAAGDSLALWVGASVAASIWSASGDSLGLWIGDSLQPAGTVSIDGSGLRIIRRKRRRKDPRRPEDYERERKLDEEYERSLEPVPPKPAPPRVFAEPRAAVPSALPKAAQAALEREQREEKERRARQRRANAAVIMMSF